MRSSSSGAGGGEAGLSTVSAQPRSAATRHRCRAPIYQRLPSGLSAQPFLDSVSNQTPRAPSGCATVRSRLLTRDKCGRRTRLFPPITASSLPNVALAHFCTFQFFKSPLLQWENKIWVKPDAPSELGDAFIQNLFVGVELFCSPLPCESYTLPQTLMFTVSSGSCATCAPCATSLIWQSFSCRSRRKVRAVEL
jgi:hypothetical protein